MKGHCDLCSSRDRHIFEHPVQKTNYLKAKKDRVAVMSCWDELKKIIQKLSFTHSTSCLPKPIQLSLDLRSCYDISHEFRTITNCSQILCHDQLVSLSVLCSQSSWVREHWVSKYTVHWHTHTHSAPKDLYIRLSLPPPLLTYCLPV